MSYHASTGRRTTIVRFCEALGAGASVHQVKHRHQKGEVARSLGITICVDDAYECVHSMALACPNWQTGILFGGRPTPQGFRHDAWVLQRTIVCGDTKDQRPKSTTVSIGSNEMIEATKVKTFRCIGMQMVPATQLTPLPKQACLAKASCNLSTCSDLLGQCWLHVISMTSFFNGIQQFQGLCTLRPRQFQIKEKLQSY